MRKIFIILFFLPLLNSCVGSSTSGVFGTGVSVALDPRTVGTQIDDSIMQKNLQARLALKEKKYLLKLSVKVLDGRIFLGGKVDKAEEKLIITKMNSIIRPFFIFIFLFLNKNCISVVLVNFLFLRQTQQHL